jgi:tetratricopeptide (TPR) repeat protein
MNTMSLRTLWASVILMVSAAGVRAQVPAPGPTAGAAPPARRSAQPRALEGDAASRVESLGTTIAELQKQGRFAEAVAPAREVLAIRARAQGEDHWQTVLARIEAETIVQAAGLPARDQSELASVYRKSDEALARYRAARYAEAQRLFREMLEVCARILGDEHAEVANIRDAVGSCLYGLGKYAEAEPFLRRALATRRRILGEDHPNKASSDNILAMSLKAQAKYVEAEPFYLAALAIRRRTLGEEHVLTATSYDNLAGNHFARGEYAKAESLSRRALATIRKARGEEDPETAYSLNNVGVIIDIQGRYAEAEPFLQAALAIRRRALGEDHPLTAMSHDRLAVNFASRGRYAEAESLYRQALAVERRALGEDHPETATCWSNLAAVVSVQGRSDEAEALFSRSLDSHIRGLGEGHPETAWSMQNLAAHLRGQGKYAEADRLYRKVLATRKSALGEGHPDTAVSYYELAGNESRRGRYSDGISLHRQALHNRRRALGEEHPDTASSYRRLAAVLHAQGQDGEAESMARAAARSYEAARLRISPAGLERAEFASGLSPNPLLAALLARRGRDVEAWACWESGMARGLFDDLEARRHQPLTADEHLARAELVNRLGHLDNRIGALTAVAAPSDDQRRRLEALRGERLDFQGRLARFEAGLARNYHIAAGEVYALETIRARLADDAALIGWLDLESATGAADPRGDHWVCVVRRRGAPRWIRIAGTGADGAWTKADDQRPGQVRQLLSSEDRSAWRDPSADLARQRLAPLEPALGAGDDRPAVRQVIVLPSPAMAGIPIEALLESRPASAPRYLVTYAPSGTLYAWLRERRGEGRDPSARSGRLLALGDPVPPPTEGPDPPLPDQGLLVQRVVRGANADRAGIRPDDVLVRYAGAPLAAPDDLTKRVRAGDSKAAGVVVSVWRGGRTFDRTLEPGPLGVQLSDRPAAEALLARRSADATVRRSRSAAFVRLPGSAREVRAVAGLFERSEVHLGSDASEQTLDALRSRNELATFAVIHLATHGEVDDLSPMNTRLILSQDRLPDPMAPVSLDGPAYDGMLTAGEVMGTWKLKAELVTLSACQSGLGRPSGGEGYVGFAQAFFLAGARSLVVSLWKVDDRATSLLMTRFYQNWLGKRPGLDRPLSKADALREAKAWLSRLDGSEVDRELESIERGGLKSRSSRPAADHPFAHPHDWAGFILLGDPD